MMQIEEYFRDTKNHRFGWSFEDARVTTTMRATVLLLIAALSCLAVTLVGRVAEDLGIHKEYQANTVSNRRVLSLFFLGKSIIQRWEHLALPGLDPELANLQVFEI